MSRCEEGMPSVGDTRQDEEAVLSQPSLREKRAHFELMRRLGEEVDGSDDEGEGGEANGARRRDRERCMRFFLRDGRGEHEREHEREGNSGENKSKDGGEGEGKGEGGGVSGAPQVRVGNKTSHVGRGKSETTSVVREQKDMAPFRGQTDAAPVPHQTENASVTHDQRKNAPIAPHHTPANRPTTTTTKQNHQTRHPSRKVTTSTTPIIQATDPDEYPRPLKHRRGLPDLANETIIPDTTRATKTHPRRPATPLPLPKHTNNSTPIQSLPQTKKRKRNSSTILRLRSENERIFTDLHFYYIPNDDIAPLRKLRIGKAREYGATWTRDVSAATHVIVDKGIPYPDVRKVLGEEAQGEKAGRGPVVVNEDYPVDCIQFKALLDHGQMKYRTPGQGVGEASTGGSGTGGAMKSGGTVGGRSRNGMPREEDQVEDMMGPSKGDGSLGDGGNAAGEGAGATAFVESHPNNGALIEGITGGKESNDEHEQKYGSDELSQYIKLMQEYKDLPLEHEDEDTELRSAAGDSPEPYAHHSGDENKDQSDEEESRSCSDPEQPAHKTRTKTKFRRAEDQFACHRAGAQFADANNPNAPTIAVLQRMADYYDRTNDHWRTTSYRKAISTLKQHNTKVTSEAQAVQLPHIGQSLAQKIQEIATTNKLRRLKYAEQSTDEEPMQSSAYQLFLQIHGVGTHQAQQWLSWGHRTLEDLKAKVKLTPAQRIGIDRFEDLNKRIPRHEVAALGAHVQEAAAKIDPSVELIIGGSYRRGSPTSGDIDFIVTKR
ncbi:hypothetical protein E4U17_007357, partial [Claviceps sp. LM77 group G4]